jgi:hypothetical protein
MTTRAAHRLGRRRARTPHRSLVESWTMLFDDPPALCCTDDQLCPACALDAGDQVTNRS